jgi:hypothetical protein
MSKAPVLRCLADRQDADQLPVGDDAHYLDQGNQITLAVDRSLLFGSAKGIVRLRPC